MARKFELCYLYHSYLQYSRQLGTQIVDIYVGPNRRHFHLHKQILCDKVPFFQMMLTGGYKETQDQEASLEEDDPDAFDLFVQWLYKDRLLPIDVSKQTPDLDCGPFFDLIKLYYFAEKICLADLMDYVMSVLQAAYDKSVLEEPYNDFETLVNLTVMKYVNQNTSPAAKLRLFMAEQYHHVTRPPGYEFRSWYTMPPSLVERPELAEDIDVMELIQSIQNQPPKMPMLGPMRGPFCYYHIHEVKDKQ